MTVAFAVGAGGFPGADAWAAKPAGAVVAAKKLPKRLWIPGTTARAYKLTYVTTDGRGKRAPSTGTVFLPKGRAPRGGWPVISWAHGTSGLADACAPSRVGPALPERDRPYLAKWMRAGYAIVASDYAGLGTPGLAAYLHGRSEAHNIVDIVKAGRAYTRAELAAPKWVVVGQSQGAGAAIYTARWATRFGGRGLDYRGAVGTGTPAYIEKIVETLEPGDLTITPGHRRPTSATSWRGCAGSHPELGLDGVADRERHEVPGGWPRRQCVFDYEKSLEGVNFGPLVLEARGAGCRTSRKTLDDYMAMPEKGFDKPFFMGHGTKDTDVPYGLAAAYVRALKANTAAGALQRRTSSDHSGTLIASQEDTLPFVRRLFARKSR